MPTQQSEVNHWKRLSRRSGVDALLRRDDLKSSLRVVPGLTTTETDGGGGVVYTSRQADFLFCLAEVQFEGKCVELRAHDRLEIFEQDFEILPTDGERHYDPAGNYGIMGRIHTRLIGPVKGSKILVRDVKELFARDASGSFAGAHVDADAS